MSGGALLLLSGAGAGPPAASPAPTISGLIPGGLRQTLSWKTDILRAQTGLEKRQALRGAPRERWDLSYVLAQATVEKLRASLVTLGAGTVQIPAAHIPLAALTAITSTSFDVDTTYTDALHANNGVLLIVNDSDQAYVANVTAVSSGTPGVITVTVDVTPPAGQTYSAGSTIYLLKTVVLDDGSKLGRYRVSMGTFALSGALALSSSAPTGTGGTVATFDSLPVMDKPRVQEATQVAGEQVHLGLELLDQGGAFSMRTSQPFGELRRPFALILRSAADRQWLIAFVQGLLGRQGLFLLPTDRDDLTLTTNPSGGTSLIVDSAAGYVATWFPSLAHRRLKLVDPAGTVQYVKISAAVDNGNGTQTLTSTTTITLSSVSHVSFLEQCRLDSDDVEIAWEATRGTTSLTGLVVQQ